MTDHAGCVGAPVDFPDGESMEAIRYGSETHAWDYSVDCHDCFATPGTFHHPGCDVEECPRCHGQLISCGCLWGDDEDG